MKYLTGISCAGCGLTRAWICVFRLQFAQAFVYHPLYWTIPPAVVMMLSKKHIPGWISSVLATLLIVAFLMIYLMRLFDGDDFVVTISLSEGMIAKIMRFIKEKIL